LFEDGLDVSILVRGQHWPPQLREFRWDGRATSVFATTVSVDGHPVSVDTFVNEF
jgi:hypothetical protein